MQIHHFIKFLVKKKVKVNTCSVQGKFMEIDTYNDYYSKKCLKMINMKILISQKRIKKIIENKILKKF